MAKNKTTVPAEFGYFDKYQQRKIELTAKPDEMVVTIAPTPEDPSVSFAESDVRTASEKNSMQGVSKANFKRGIAVINVASDALSLEVAKSEPGEEFLNAIPAFVDSDGLTRYFVPDEITVQFNPDVDDQQAQEIIREQGSSVIVKQRTPGYYTIAVPEGSDAFATIEKFNELDTVRFAETSEIGFDDEQFDPPNDPRFAELWGLNNTGQTIQGSSGTPGADIGVLEAWDTTRGDENVIIVVIDTGMDIDHEDLAGNLLPRGNEDWNFANEDSSPDDSGSHGTHVCGTCAAVMNNGKGVAGVSPECKLMPLRINLQAGMNANRADAINFAGDKAEANTDKRYVVNCSWRASGSFSAILMAIDTCVSKGALVVFAAGNASRDMDTEPPQFPGVHPTAICVAALDSRDKLASFSNVGSKVDVSAPGVNILSTEPGDQYGFKNGTSMASPHVAGTIALIWSANMSLGNSQVRQILESTCDDVDGVNAGLVGKLGKGRINAAKAVAEATRFAIV